MTLNLADLALLIQWLVPGIVAWVSVKSSLAVALERAEAALEQARRANERIDKMQAAQVTCKTQTQN